MRVKSPQSCPTHCNPMDCSLPGSSIHGILLARILEWVACPPPGDLTTQHSKIGGDFAPLTLSFPISKWEQSYRMGVVRVKRNPASKCLAWSPRLAAHIYGDRQHRYDVLLRPAGSSQTRGCLPTRWLWAGSPAWTKAPAPRGACAGPELC